MFLYVTFLSKIIINIEKKKKKKKKKESELRTQNSELFYLTKNKYQATFKLYTRLLKLFRSIIIV